MRRGIKKRTLLLFLIFLMIIFDTNIFFTYYITRIYALVPLLVCVSISFLLYERKLNFIRKEIRFADKYVVMTVLSYLILFIVTKMQDVCKRGHFFI